MNFQFTPSLDTFGTFILASMSDNFAEILDHKFRERLSNGDNAIKENSPPTPTPAYNSPR